MSFDLIDRRIVLGSLFALLCARPGLAQDADESEHGSGRGGGASGGGEHSGGQHGRPEDPHSGEDDHDHGDDDAHGEDEHSEDDHGEDHGSGGKGKGKSQYRGGQSTVVSGFGRGRSLEERVLKIPEF